MSGNLIGINQKNVEQRQQVKQAFVLQSLTTTIYQYQELSNYLNKIACKVCFLIKCDRLIITVIQENTEQIIASNLAIDKPDKYNNIISKTLKNIKQNLEYGKVDNNFFYYIQLETIAGEIIGGIYAANIPPHSYTQEEISTLELFAELAATKIENYHLSQQHQKMNRTFQAEIAKHSKELNIIKVQLNKNYHLAHIGEFTASIIHQIRNSLTIIKMGLDYFSKVKKLPQSAKERLSLSIDEEKRLERLLQEILLYSKSETLQLSELEINNLIQKSLIIIEQMPQAKGRIIEFIPFPQPINILGDADKLKQIFINLLRNACEAVGNGELIQWRVSYPHPDYVSISIHNGGSPIPSFMLPKITQPFYSSKSDGTGLGLTIVEQIVKAHGGKLSIQSNSTTGTIVKVQLVVA